MRYLAVGAVILTFCLTGTVFANEEKILRKIEGTGGKITYDRELPGKPVVGVTLKKGLVESVTLKELAVFTQLKFLDTGDVKITDADLKELKDLKQLNHLVLPYFLITDTTLRELSQIGLLHALSRATAEEGKRPNNSSEVCSFDLKSAKVTAEGLKELKDFKQVTTLDLDLHQVTDEVIKVLAELDLLHALTLAAGEPNEQVKKAMEQYGSLAALESLSNPKSFKRPKNAADVRLLNLRNVKITQAGWKHFVSFKQLQVLDLGGEWAKDETCKELKSFEQLTALSLQGTSITTIGLKELKNLARLRTLHFDQREITDEIVSVLMENKQLHLLTIATGKAGARPKDDEEIRGLDLSSTKITNKGLTALSGLKALEALESLDLDDTRITNDGFKELKGFKQLKDLSINCKNATDETLKVLAESGLLHTIDRAFGERTKKEMRDEEVLTKLWNAILLGIRVRDAKTFKTPKDVNNVRWFLLPDSNLTDRGLKECVAFKKLEVLLVGGGGITDDGLKELKQLKELTTLYLCGTKVTKEGVADLQKALPNCKIVLKNEFGS